MLFVKQKDAALSYIVSLVETKRVLRKSRIRQRAQASKAIQHWSTRAGRFTRLRGDVNLVQSTIRAMKMWNLRLPHLSNWLQLLGLGPKIKHLIG